MKERRKHERKFAEIHAELVVESLHLQGATINISENGCLIQVCVDGVLPAGLTNKSASLWLAWEDKIVESTARIVRVDHNLLALEVVAVDIEGACLIKSKFSTL